MKSLALISCFFISSGLYSQDISEARIPESSSEIEEERSSAEAETRFSLEPVRFPIDLNTAGQDELKNCGLFNDFQIYNLFEHREKNGKLLSIYELQAIEGFDPAVIQSIRPYIAVSAEDLALIRDPESMRTSVAMLARRGIQERKGYNAPARYLGNPLKMLVKVRHSIRKNLIAGLTAEKDPGEPFLGPANKLGFDYYSGYIQLNDYRMVKKLVLGDFEAGYGQGLILWNSFSLGKSSEVINAARYSPGIISHKGADESGFFRGAGLSLGKKAFVADILYSVKKVDARFDSSDQTYSAPDNTGLHRTINELNRKGSLSETVGSIHLAYRKRFLKLGLTGAFAKLNGNLGRSPHPGDLYDPGGGITANTGLNYYWQVRNMSFFGEAAVDRQRDPAVIAGLMMSLDSRLSISYHYRNYHPGYQAVKGKTFSENTSVGNEASNYLGVQYRAGKAVVISAYYDLYTFPWLKYRKNSPSFGSDRMLRADYPASKTVKFYISARRKVDEENDSFEKLRKHAAVTKENLRVNLDYSLVSSFNLRSRVEFCRYNKAFLTEHGILLLQDISYRLLFWSFTLRYTLFETDSYNSRIYTFENDLPDSFSILSLFGEGSRFYILGRYDIGRNAGLWLKYGQTLYVKGKTIGSGWDQIEGNLSSEIAAELKISF
jgi:hypothetical protein